MSARSTTVAARPGGAVAPSAGTPVDTESWDDPVAGARRHIADTALRESSGDMVGLELEFHLVDLARPGRRPQWPEVQALVAAMPPMPSGSTVTLEPGGQLELSTPPATGAAASIAALRADRQVLRAAVAAAGFGTAPLGADPARPPRRINPHHRYVAMEAHFRGLGCAAPGTAMMTATAALQINLDAGPAHAWSSRLRHINDLGPVLVAVSACSPLLGGAETGWRSSRQQAWHGIDQRRSGPVVGDEPVAAWVDYALQAPVMAVTEPVDEPDDERGGEARGESSVTPLTTAVSFADWLNGRAPIERRPTRRDLDFHLTTLFPPLRPRGYLELRCLDALPDRWWPAMAAITVALIDDPVAAEIAAESCEAVRGRWTEAARDGLGDPLIAAAATACLDAAARRCAPELKAEVEAYAELVTRGRTPGDELLDRVRASSPLSVLEEEARA